MTRRRHNPSTIGAATARAGMKEPTARTIWSYRDEFQTWKHYDSSGALRYTRDAIDAVRFVRFVPTTRANDAR